MEQKLEKVTMSQHYHKPRLLGSDNAASIGKSPADKDSKNDRDFPIRQPIVTIAGHVDHGKTSILDCFRDSSIQEGEAGGITQKISFTKFPLEHLRNACSLIEKHGIKLELPGFLFIDTPGHAAFTNLRKRGGSLADLAVLVVSIKEGIKPQTAEVLQILKAHRTPFLIALNKIDTISGWKTNLDKSLKESINSQALNVRNEFDEELLTFQGALQSQGFESDLYFDIDDFTKKIAIVPCSARTREGISELLFVLCGLSQRYLKSRLKLNERAKGVVLEVKKAKGFDSVECILYDGKLKAGDEIAIGSFDGEPIISKVRAIDEIEPLCENKYSNVREASAATGVRLHLTTKEEILPGMPFEILKDNLDELKASFKREVSESVKLDKEGIIVKADSLGSLEALLTLLRQEGIKIVKAGIGDIGKADLISAKANLELNELDSVILGFNVSVEEGLETSGIKVIEGDVVYKLIENLNEWRTHRAAEVERERMIGLASVCKLEILHQHVFRNSNPAIFGVGVLGGNIKTGIKLIDDSGEEVARVKGLQLDKNSIQEAGEGQELAISLPGINFERRLSDRRYLYSDISEKQFKAFKENKDLLSEKEKGVLMEIAEIKRRGREGWGMQV